MGNYITRVNWVRTIVNNYDKISPMAKKGNRQLFNLQCSVCKNRNYLISKNTVNIKEKLILKKFCKMCRKTTEHNEVKIGK